MVGILLSSEEEQTEKEKELKIQILDIYNHKLEKRIRRKKFVIERDLLNLKKQKELERFRTDEEKEIHNLLKVFARFSTPKEHEELVENIIKQRSLKKRIEELISYKNMGIKNFEQLEVNFF